MNTKRILLVAVVAGLSQSLHAALPVFRGASYDTDLGQGYNDASVPATSAISNIGYAVGEATFRTPSQPNGGRRALKWTPNGWTSFPASPPNLSGYTTSHVAAIHPVSNISVGDSETFSAGGLSLGFRALRWAENGVATQLSGIGASPTGHADTRALAVNSFGTTVGFSSKYVGADYRGKRAVRWSANTSNYFELDTLAPQPGSGYLDSHAIDINESAVSAGTSDFYSNGSYLGQRAVRWNAVGAITQLGVLGSATTGFTHVESVGINNEGVIAGLASKYDASGDYLGKRAVRYAANSITAVELGGLGGTTVGGFSSARVRSISDSGLIVGASNKYLLGADIGTRAVYWNTTGAAAANELPGLGTNNGVAEALANAANADDVIAGWCEKYVNNVSQGKRAVIWTTAGTDAVIDLNTLIDDPKWLLTEAAAISDTGFVSGIGQFDDDGASSGPAYTRHFSMLIPQAGTYGRGDANFDTKINFDDLLLLAQHYGQSNVGKEHDVGDLNLDGNINFDDLLALAQHYQAGAILSTDDLDATFTAHWALARSMVPEPSSIMALSSIAFAARRRR